MSFHRRPSIRRSAALLAVIFLIFQSIPLAAARSFTPLACYAILREDARMNAPMLFGVINDAGLHYPDEWSRGVRVTTFEFQWFRYQPTEGAVDAQYVDAMKSLLRGLRAQGWQIQMVPGIQYVPAWVFANYPDMVYVNQYGNRYLPGLGPQISYQAINAPFNPRARDLIAAYLARIFQDFNQNDPGLRFDAVRVGGGVQGELRYPIPTWNGHTNAFWAFDAAAQNPAVSGIPPEVVGWKPGVDANPGSLNVSNLVVNGGFETRPPGYSVLGWSPDPQVQADLATIQPASGAAALRLQLSQPGRMHQFVRIQPGVVYQFGGRLRVGAGATARLFITQYTAGFTLVSGAPAVKLETGATGWTAAAGVFNTSPGTKFVKLELDGASAGTYFFDDLYIKRQGDAGTAARNVDVPQKFFDWYVQKLTDYQNWQIAELRKYAPSARLDMMYPGKGVLEYQVIDALTNDLMGDGWSESNSGLYSGGMYARHTVALPADGRIALYLTGIEDPPLSAVNDHSPYSNDWSAAKWIAYLAHSRGLPVWAENSGANNAAQMRLSLSRALENGYDGLLWGFETELYSGRYATMNDYAGIIGTVVNPRRVFLPFCAE
jgi:hypothetical protein